MMAAAQNDATVALILVFCLVLVTLFSSPRRPPRF